MEDGKKSENHLTSAAAFVEGGVQEACDDACSICLEVFCESEPSTVTVCKHEFHLQCILEWSRLVRDVNYSWNGEFHSEVIPTFGSRCKSGINDSGNKPLPQSSPPLIKGE